jgi:hypothetical protein
LTKPPKGVILNKRLGIARRGGWNSWVVRRDLLVLIGLTDVVLGIEIKTELSDEIKLGFQEVDVLFLVVHELHIPRSQSQTPKTAQKPSDAS